tara:strand:+ start:207 stop:362 length:156 start_codon:yes stop_codon:yes gene_type:complete
VSHIEIVKSVPTALIKGGPKIVHAINAMHASLKNNKNNLVFLPSLEILFLK